MKYKISFILFSIFEGSDRTLVFVEQKRNADFLASYLSQSGFPTTSIHGSVAVIFMIIFILP